MGCKYSKVEDEEAVRRCRDRKKLMKQLGCRRVDLAAAHITYLQALRNTGATLRQFVEVESALSQQTSVGIPVAASSPPPPPPPPPPPLPPAYSVTSSMPPHSVTSSMPSSPLHPPLIPFSPIRIRKREKRDGELDEDDSTDDDSDSCSTPLPPPPPPGMEWEHIDPIAMRPLNFPSLLVDRNDKEVASQVTMDDDWVESSTEFDGDDESVSDNDDGVVRRVELHQAKSRVLGDENSSMVGWMTKDSDSSVVDLRSDKSLVGIAKEIDEYFLKAAASGSDVVILLDSASGRLDTSELEVKRGAGKKSKSAKVFSTLSWSWSFKSAQANRESSSDAGGYGYHGKTLDKLYDEEQKLYKLVKDEEFARLQYRKYTSLLQRLESGEHDRLHAEKVRDNIEELQTRIMSLEEAVSLACLTISRLRDEELYPQVIELSAGLVHMWRNMYECHQVQNHIAQQASLLGNRPGSEPTTDSHCYAATQLEVEVSAWHSSFCNLITLQREYVTILNQWISLTDCLPDDDGFMRSSSGIRSLCGELQHALERLREKPAAEAIKTFLSVIHSIVLQQAEERQLKKKSDNIESKFHSQLEKHSENAMQTSGQASQARTYSVPKDEPKLDAFRKRVEEEKARYLNSLRTSRAMTLNNLQTSLPKVFQALTGFSGVCVQAFEGISRCSEVVASHSGAASPAVSSCDEHPL
ncbi:protein ALTERED PHOSPHATE STARVATION RESPONSE 1-like isoform X2 [Lolium rigidum]|uniref:protein ALTERED PHOSPHATE STARVATION RESPONSE 1-like isoform X2 n=1 Tax=Lolium rigidum TaxID=89674 RepID=UPI001F5CB54E|nr:protein ALTERED PHOSPHATE STARVATION RESPONSE 1-like isoform X2 [Lolium rigidum]